MADAYDLAQKVYWLKERRLKANMKIRTIADAMGVNFEVVKFIESGGGTPEQECAYCMVLENFAPSSLWKNNN